jgi:hypothetical protein
VFFDFLFSLFVPSFSCCLAKIRSYVKQEPKNDVFRKKIAGISLRSILKMRRMRRYVAGKSGFHCHAKHDRAATLRVSFSSQLPRQKIKQPTQKGRLFICK